MLTRHIQESLQVTPGPFPDFWVGPGDEATINLGHLNSGQICSYQLELLVLSSGYFSLVPRPRPLTRKGVW